MRPIDADALKLALSQSYNDPENVVDEAPTLDYAPVVHATWQLVAYNKTPFREGLCLVCTACGFANAYDALFNHCPNCGANMMDGGKKDER